MVTGIRIALFLLAASISFCSAQAQDALFPPDDDVASRLRKIEAEHQSFVQQLEALRAENADLTARLQTQSSETEVDPAGSMPEIPAGDELPLFILKTEQPSQVRTDQPFTPQELEAEEQDPFAKPLIWGSKDGEWTLQFHNETQLDIRAYGQAHQDPVNQVGFYIPRMRLIFNGHLTKPIEYNVSINKGLGSLDLLDAYFNFNYDSRAQFQIGRYRVPFTYDWYALSNQFLTTPERSVFALNYGYNRNTGVMMHGEILDESAEYALAVVNGPRNSYYDTNTAKDLLGFLNVRPFQHSSRFPWLEYMNLGGSFAFGWQDQAPLPISFHTSASATTSGGTDVGVPTFLRLNDHVLEKGKRSLWEAHLAYYYQQLTFMAAVDGGVNTYGFRNQAGAVEVPVWAWHVQFGYFLTGEEITRRTMVEVKRPFDLRKGKRGPGAWEIQARFDRFQLGDEVFTGGLAAPTGWTNRVNTLDCGVNWYLNRYVRIAFDWQRSMYADQVQYAPGRTSDHSDLFWIRFQDYF